MSQPYEIEVEALKECVDELKERLTQAEADCRLLQEALSSIQQRSERDSEIYKIATEALAGAVQE